MPQGHKNINSSGSEFIHQICAKISTNKSSKNPFLKAEPFSKFVEQLHFMEHEMMIKETTDKCEL